MEFEVMHFILHVSVWLHQGFHVNPAYLHGYGLCCRMSNPNPDDDTTSGSNIVNPPDAGRQGQLAGGLTKVLPGPALSDMRDKLHLVDVGPAPREPCGGVS